MSITNTGKLKRRAGRVASKVIRWADERVDFPKVDEVTRSLRIRMCEGNVCGKFDAAARQCLACGCMMDLKVTLVKSPFTGEEIRCPEGYW